MCVGSVGTITKLDGKRATVDFGGVRTEIRVDFLPDAAIGDRVLIHAGFAISRVSDQEAAEMEAVWADLREALGQRRAHGEGAGDDEGVPA
jgi:hydrogenase expression/formation protein HypC